MSRCINCGSTEVRYVIGGDVYLCRDCASDFAKEAKELNQSKSLEQAQQCHQMMIQNIKYSSILKRNPTKVILNAVEEKYRAIVSEDGTVTGSILEDADWKNTEGGSILDSNNTDTWDYQSRFSTASGRNLPYVVLQVTLKEKFFGTGSGNLQDLEQVINEQVAKGYRLHTMSTSNGGSKGFAGGDRIQATLVFERLDVTNGTYQPKEN